MLTLLDFENAILDLFEKNRITIQDAKIVLWTLLTDIYEDELIEEPQRRETIIENIRDRRNCLLLICWARDEEAIVILILTYQYDKLYYF
jgi:hypothetical protein